MVKCRFWKMNIKIYCTEITYLNNTQLIINDKKLIKKNNTMGDFLITHIYLAMKKK